MMNKREVKAIADREANAAVARHERIDHPGTKGTTTMKTGNDAKIDEARKMVEEHRSEHHHMVEQHKMSGSVPRTPMQPTGGEPHPKDHEDKIVDG